MVGQEPGTGDIPRGSSLRMSAKLVERARQLPGRCSDLRWGRYLAGGCCGVGAGQIIVRGMRQVLEWHVCAVEKGVVR